MYPSGVWRGFWQQAGYGRQPMDDFRLAFGGGRVTGSGIDIVGRFAFSGEYDSSTGRVAMVKQYLGRHQVLYEGGPDGEGSILGTWAIPVEWFGTAYTGSFLLRPVIDGTAEVREEEFVEITK